MPNAYPNKIQVMRGGQTETLIDLTADTITASALMQGYTAHDASGAPITGTATGGSMVIRDEADSHGGTIRHITAGTVVTGTVSITENGSYDVAQYADAVVSVPAPAPSLQSKTATPTESQQTVTPDSGYDGLSSVSVDAISSTYVGTSITRRSSTDLTASGATVTVPSGYYQSQASKAVASGTAGTPTATKGTVSNHSVSVTPSVTNTTGYISGGTKTGTAVTVSASELVSGTKSITENGTGIDVTDYESVDVSVSSSATHTATLSGTGSASYCYVQVNETGTRYYTDGDEVEFSSGDTIYLTCSGKRGGATIIVNGTTVASTESGSTSYTLTPPSYDFGIQIVYSNDSVMTVTYPTKSITTNGVHDVADYALANVSVSGSGMSEADLKNFISRSTSFTDIDWPSGMVVIGDYAFAGCLKFNPSSLPSGITTIRQYAFYGCTSLALTSLPSGVTSIEPSAFQGCTNLALTSLPSGLSVIDNYAFNSCTNLALTSLPSNVTAINTYAFYGCTSLALASLPSGLMTINMYGFARCTSLTLTSLPSSITGIGTYAFNCCTGLTSISCSGTITTLGTGAFTGSSIYPMALTSASFPNLAITSSLGIVFGNPTAANACQHLEFCDIGNAVGINASAFANCYALETLVIRKTSVCTLANVSAFLNTPMSGYNSKTGTVYVPSSLIDSYKAASNWKTLYDGGTLTFSAIEGSDYEL